MASKIKQVTRPDWRVVGSAALGVALFGVGIYFSRMLANQLRSSGQSTIGNAVDKAADVATSV